ncbi:MAG: hypothetical protein KBB91_02420 [Candidatus Pacebacteria bacterium]|nr:hypothetical protein [Candidatus Paceibacterota bacterium]
MSQKTIPITNGPSREELFDGSRLFAEKREVVFNIEDNGRSLALPVIMQGIQPEDGSGQSWNVVFNIEVKHLLRLGLPVDVKSVFTGKKVVQMKAYYSTKTRKGVITFGSTMPDRKHRLVLHNILVNRTNIEEMMRAELGAVNVINWELERTIKYEDYPLGAIYKAPQCDRVVVVKYTEK